MGQLHGRSDVNLAVTNFEFSLDSFGGGCEGVGPLLTFIFYCCLFVSR